METKPPPLAGSAKGVVAITWDGSVPCSADGEAWEPVHSIPNVQLDGLCNRVGASDIGFLAVALVRDTDDFNYPTAWFSEDGRTWARVPIGPLGDEPESGSLCHHDVIAFDGGFLSVTDGQGGEEQGGPHDLVDMVWRYER